MWWAVLFLAALPVVANGHVPWRTVRRQRWVRQIDSEATQNGEVEIPQCGESADKCADFFGLGSRAYAHNYCVNVVLSNRTFESANATDMQVGGLIFPYEVNVTDDRITLQVQGSTSAASARIVDGFGCQLMFDEIMRPVIVNITSNESNETDYVSDYEWQEAKEGMEFAMPDVDYAALSAIIDKEFNVEANATYVHGAKTKSVLVVYKGRIVAERYSDWLDITADTPLVGWSMTKTLTSALVGIRINDRRMSLNRVARNAFWTVEEKMTRNITVKNLLQMTSGIKWDEDYGAITDVSRMLYSAPSAPDYVSRRPQESIAGTVFEYSSGNTNLLQHALRLSFNAAGGDRAYWSYPKQRLFDPIGAKSFQMMTDSMGTFIGSSYSVATTRDWARIGQLYLNGGVWEGRTVLTPEWVNFTTTPTEASDGEYSAGLWILPQDADVTGPQHGYYLGGYGGQIVAVFPSKDLVVVRLGYTLGFKEFDSNQFAQRIAALFPSAER